MISDFITKLMFTHLTVVIKLLKLSSLLNKTKKRYFGLYFKLQYY